MGATIDDQNNQTGGAFGFGNRATGVGTAVLLGYVTSASINDADILDRRTDYYGMFLQDDWEGDHEADRQLGHPLRMGYAVVGPQQPDEQLRLESDQPGLSAFRAWSPSPAATAWVRAQDLPRRHWAAFGLAYQLDSKTVIRTGYGINYYGEYTTVRCRTLLRSVSTRKRFTSPDGGFTQTFYLDQGMPPTTQAELGPGLRLGRVRPSADGLSAVSPRNQRNPMVQQWNFGIQRQLPKDFLIEATYMANVAHRLGGPNFNWNMIP
ncbi:MAG: hypothetical protein R2724_02305 [Bryobacterales bacterium]